MLGGEKPQQQQQSQQTSAKCMDVLCNKNVTNSFEFWIAAVAPSSSSEAILQAIDRGASKKNPGWSFPFFFWGFDDRLKTKS